MSPLLLLLAAAPAKAGEFMDIWVTTAVEDTNVRAGPENYSPGPNFVERGNRTFFENYESFYTDDITQGHLVLYRADEGFFPNWWSEAAFVLEYTPYLNPDVSKPGVFIRDDGSYVRIGRDLGGVEDHHISLTGYAVNASRFRLGYSWDLAYGGREIVTPRVGAMPGVRLQWQRKGTYVFAGMKTAINQRTEESWEGDRNATYYSFLSGAGLNLLNDRLKLEAGLGSFQQGQIINVRDTSSPLYGEIISALGTSGQISYRSTNELPFIQSSELRLYRNAPEFMRDTYIRHRQLDGFGWLVQAEVNRLTHNLLDPDNEAQTVLESALAGDVQAFLIFRTTEIFVDFVYKDLPYIVFNVPGLTSGTAISETVTWSPQLYTRFKVSHYFPNARLTPSFGIGVMQPAAYTTSDGKTFVQYTERDKEAVPDGQEASDILGSVLGLQVDVTPSTVVVGELLFTKDANQSRVEEASDGVRLRVQEDPEVINALGFNLMLRAHF
ncbi:MAG: hypothetical protein H6739_18985 [Alphaproteobacteria bacterium]|nr:hypothetical protein [Alphaproteobacteria bacterium]